MLDEPLELLEVPALERAITVDGVFTDDRVAGVPVRLRLRVEPEHMAGPLAHLCDHPRLRGVVVVPGVAEEDDAGLGRDLLAPPLPEGLEGMAVVGVTVDPDHV